MNPVEIEESLTTFSQKAFDPIEFPFKFLECFGFKQTTINRLKNGVSNKSDLEHGFLLRNNLHIVICSEGYVGEKLSQLRNSPATTKWKAQIVLATDGQELQAENLTNGEVIACDYKNFSDHFGFLLSLAGVATTKEIRNNPIDIKAAGSLNKLYVELLKTNKDWASASRREDMNKFMARLIFCFFAEDTDLFKK